MNQGRDLMKLNFSRRHFTASVAAFGLTAVALPLTFGDETANTATEHPLAPALRHAKTCLERVYEMPGYECAFAKKEVVGKHLITQTMRMKIRHDPFSVYMYFDEPNAGREVIFVTGKNNNNLLVHESGFKSLIGTLELAPDGGQAMAENRYPITKAGIGKMLESIIEQWEEESKYGETDVKYFEDAKVEDMKCRVIESSHPQPRRQFKFQMTRLWIEEKSGLPVRVQQFGFPTKKDTKPPMIEDYTFSNIKAEIRLTDRDFDTKNPSYNY